MESQRVDNKTMMVSQQQVWDSEADDDATIDGDDEAKRWWRQATTIVELQRRGGTLVR
jgi:hypothetical protein